MACNHCEEFSRSHLVRAAVAEAGRGLPAIERGMPTPAGTGLNRRSFLLRSGAAMLSVYGASRLGLGDLQTGIAQAAGSDQRVLVSIFLDGGIDSLSVLSPTTDAVYRALRPTLALPAGIGSAFTEDPTLRWNPAAAAFDALHRAGKMSVLPAVGYTSPDQSHFTSRHYWEVGGLLPNEITGWMGRLLDRIGTADNPLQGLSLDGSLSPALATASLPVAAIDGPSYDLWARGVWGKPEELMFGSVGELGRASAGSKDPGLQAAGAAAAQAMQLKSQLDPFSGEEITPPVPYPQGDGESFGAGLSSLAAMLAAGLPIRCAAISGPGEFDTHDDQADSFDSDLKMTADSIAAFQADLEARGIADRVLTLVWSEFGRRPEENDSGTDHGAGGAAYVIGTKVRGQMIGEFPGLAQLDADDNLRATSDFRGLYCSIVEQWFGVDAASVIPSAGSFTRPALIA
ncbi:MAG: hypothetical protein QOI10_1752 [Solirubrobacterales bacterium]|jgi:uncharacterized protein (DUF1501 family)|nr:hypothetical protein [Solirubrobacterales bacterium]